MYHQTPTRIVQLTELRPAAFLPAHEPDALTATTPAPPPPPHPEAATTPCQCAAPDPCWRHMPGVVLPPTPPLAPRADEGAVDRATVAALEAAAADTADHADDGSAPSVCQCIAPEPCRVHPEDRPFIARQPAWNRPAPGSPIARTIARHAAERAAGVLPGAEPGQGVDVLPMLTDHELGAWTQALLAEHHRRASRFRDYRDGARTVAGMQ